VNRDAAERQRAFTTLLRSPVLDRHTHPDAWPLVRAHRAALGEWFAQRLGYRLVVTDSAARLFRLPVDCAVVAPRRFRPPTRRVLVLAVLAAAAEDAEDITTTQDLSDRVRVLSTHEDVELALYDPDRFAERQLDVFVCENPTIAEAAADALGPACPPLACTDGIASGAALDLLAGLATAGCTIHARADFDPAGFTITDQVLSVTPGALSWRFNARTYAEECGLSGHHDAPDGLAAAVAGLRVVHDFARSPVHEERVLALLLSDLAAGAGPADG